MGTFIAIIPYIQIALAVLLVAAILVQKASSDAGGTFGGSDNMSAAYHTRRGFEKFIFDATIILAILFVAASLAALFLQ